jgi:hypothetical protein
MEKKNSQQHINTSDLVKSAGCNFILVLITLIIAVMLAFFGLITFRLYFWGLESAWIQPLQDPIYLIAFGTVVLAIFFVLSTTWRNVAGLYTKFRRYRTMQQEKARIDRLIKSDEAQDNQNAALLQYAEDAAYQELTNGKR